MDNNLENKTNFADSYLYSNYDALVKLQKDNKEKYSNFIDRIKEFENISTLKEAKELAKKILPTVNEISRFKIGNAQCTVVNQENLFRVSIDSQEEFICYDFV